MPAAACSRVRRPPHRAPLGVFAPWRETFSLRSRPLNDWKLVLFALALLLCVFQGLFTYDVAGNRLTAIYNAGVAEAQVLTSTYDALNRLATLTEGGRTSVYGYDAAGRRSAGLRETVRAASFCD